MNAEMKRLRNFFVWTLQVLDMCILLGLVPERFGSLKGLELYFAMARGFEDVLALDMSKYFNTNYHYLVRAHYCPG